LRARRSLAGVPVFVDAEHPDMPITRGLTSRIGTSRCLQVREQEHEPEKYKACSHDEPGGT